MKMITRKIKTDLEMNKNENTAYKTYGMQQKNMSTMKIYSYKCLH